MKVIKPWKERFIKRVNNGFRRELASSSVGIPMTKVIEEIRRDADFAKRVEEAEKTAKAPLRW